MLTDSATLHTVHSFVPGVRDFTLQLQGINDRLEGCQNWHLDQDVITSHNHICMLLSPP